MTQASIPTHADGALAGQLDEAAALPRGWSAYVELTKPRITRLVGVTGGVGFALSAIGRGLSETQLLVAGAASLVGVSLAAAGANTLNQWWERDRDALMPRTEKRPLPTARVTPVGAAGLGLALSIVGVLILWIAAGALPALITVATVALYVLVYTPLKPVTTLATVIGAVPGALPPLIGWTAAGALGEPRSMLAPLAEPGGWALFALMFVWQIPHFLAIAWMYRDDYARGGYRTLPQLDESGRATSAVMVLWAIGLVPIAMVCSNAMPDRMTLFSGVLSGVLSIAFLATTLVLANNRTSNGMRLVFFASIIYLPAVMLGMIADAMIGVVV